MAVRNFWLEATIDGRKATLTGGPKARNGGFSLTVNVREDGGISRKKLHVDGWYDEVRETLNIRALKGGTTEEVRLVTKR